MRADPWALVLLALLLLTLPLPWVAAAAAAAAVHELCHLGAVRLLGGQAHSLLLGPRGARIEAVLPSPRREILSILAGPAGSLSLVLLAGFFPRLALCGFCQGMFNLLPVGPLDGGRAARLFLHRHWPDKAGSLSLLLALAATAAAVAAALSQGLPALALLTLLALLFPAKAPG